jgi:hypothetical protein
MTAYYVQDPTPLDLIAKRLGVTRDKSIIVPCAECGIGCNPVMPVACFCILCHEKKGKKQCR